MHVLVRNHGLAAVLLATGLGVSADAQGQDYRLAFSKAENIEVFVEGANQDNWCAPNLNLRAVHGGAPDTAALARLMPRLGALFKQQCPQTATVNWRSVDAAGKPFAQGTSRAQDGWQVVAVAATLAPSATETVRDAAPAAAAPAQTAAAQDSAAQAPTPFATPSAPTVASTPTPVASQTVRADGAPAAAAVNTVAPSATPTPPAIGLHDFAVANWQPPTAQQRTALASFMTTMRDQNGCQFLSVFNFGDQAAYMRLESEKVSCAANGYAQGQGTLRLMRSDGKQIARSSTLWFSDGMIFDAPVQGITRANIVMMRDEPIPWNQTQKVAWFGFASDAVLQSHYLLRAVLGQVQGGVGVWKLRQSGSDRVQINILTAQSERFRQRDGVNMAIDVALRAVDDIMPSVRWTHLLFADDAAAWQAGDKDKLLYEIRTERFMNSRTRQLGEWRYPLQNATNHLFAREERLARREREEAQRLARQAKQEAERQERERVNQLAQLARTEQKNLRQYQALLQMQTQGGMTALREHLERDVSYQPLKMYPYIRLLEGKQDMLRRIVRVDGSKADDATIDWPYPMRLVGQKSLNKGWYWITGERRLDSAQRDDDDLPMSLVTLSHEPVHACIENGCRELLNPLSIMRIQLNQADWTPQAAQAVIDAAPKNRLGW